MITAEQMRAEAQPKLVRIIEHMVASGHPTMRAYAKAAEQLGRRPAWIQRVIGRREQVVVAAHDWLNITALCERIEAATARNDAATQAIRGEIHAARQARDSDSAMAPISRRARKREVCSVVDEERQ